MKAEATKQGCTNYLTVVFIFRNSARGQAWMISRVVDAPALFLPGECLPSAIYEIFVCL